MKSLKNKVTKITHIWDKKKKEIDFNKKQNPVYNLEDYFEFLEQFNPTMKELKKVVVFDKKFTL